MGDYSLNIHLSDSRTKEKFDFVEEVCPFKVEMLENKRESYSWQPGVCKYLEDGTWI